jgi:GntR family transcriptional regulator
MADSTDAADRIAPPVFDPRLPRSLQIEQLLRQRIARQHRAGDSFATELQLSREFGVSRTLIRAVIAKLIAAGQVSREPRHGIFVRDPVGTRHDAQVSDLVERLSAYDPDSSVEVVGISVTEGDPVTRDMLGSTPGESLVLVERVISRQLAPETFTLSYVPYRYGAFLTRAALMLKPISALLVEGGATIERVEQTIEPLLAEMEPAAHLQLPLGAPILLVQRVYHGASGAVLFCSKAFFRGQRYRVSTTFRSSLAGLPP